MLREVSWKVNGREVNGEAGCGGSIGVDYSRVFSTDGSAEGAHDDVAHPRGPGLTSLTASIADPSAHSSEATASGSRAGDPFNRREQGASGLVHGRARVLVRDVAHETRNGGEASARTLAAPVVAVTERRESGHRWWRSRVGHYSGSHARLDSSNACTRKRV